MEKVKSEEKETSKRVRSAFDANAKSGKHIFKCPKLLYSGIFYLGVFVSDRTAYFATSPEGR